MLAMYGFHSENDFWKNKLLKVDCRTAPTSIAVKNINKKRNSEPFCFLLKSVLLRREHTYVNKVCNLLNSFIRMVLSIPFDKLPWFLPLANLIIGIENQILADLENTQYMDGETNWITSIRSSILYPQIHKIHTRSDTVGSHISDVTCLHKTVTQIAPKINLLPGTLCIPNHFASQHILLPDTLYSSAHFAPQHTLITGALCSLEHFALWNTLLPGTLCSKCSREQSLKSSKEQSVPGSKVC